MTGAGGAAFALALALVWAGLVALLLLRAFRQAKRYPVLGEDAPMLAAAALPRIAVIVPVRDEAATIARCLAGLRIQDYPAERLSITVVDDNSRDGTGAIVRTVAGRDDRVRLLPGRRLPPDWAGKPFACWQGALAAEGEFLCFIDADTEAAPGLLARAASLSAQERLALLSLEPFQELGTPAERLIMPIGFLALACAEEIGRAADPAATEAAVNGQFLLVRREAYFAAGGHAAVRGEICEDSALARRIKAGGGRIGLYGAERLIATRMYGGMAALWEGLSKNVTEMFGGSLRTLGVALAGLLLGWATPLLPLAIALGFPGTAPDRAALILATLASLAVVATQIAAARHFRIPLWYALLLPIGCTLAFLLAATGVGKRAFGRVAWKGRVYQLPKRRAS